MRKIKILFLACVVLFPVLMTFQGCFNEAEAPGIDVEQYPLFKSARTDDETTALMAVDDGLAAIVKQLSVYRNDPVLVHSFLAPIEARAGSASQTEKNRAASLLARFSLIENHLKKYVKGVKTMETITTAVVTSRLLAYLENSKLIANRKSGATGLAWQAFTAAMTSGALVPLVLSEFLTDCGEPPPADGSLPPAGAEEAGAAFIDVGYAAVTSYAGTVALSGEGLKYRPFLREYVNRLHWYKKRRGENASGAHNVDQLLEGYLSALRSALMNVVQAPLYASDAQTAALHVQAWASLGSALNHRIYHGAKISELLRDLSGSSIPAQITQNPFHMVPNTPNDIDGRDWPIMVPNGVSIADGVSGSWVEVYYDNLGTMSADFDLKRLSRKLSHIDYRLRKVNDSAVIKAFRHAPDASNHIAVGQEFDLSSQNPGTDRYETYVVHAIPMDLANHPSAGSCSYVNVHWVQRPASSGSGDPVEGAMQFSMITAMDPSPPLPYDSICERYDLPLGGSLGLAPRNIYIKLGYGGGYRVEPSSLVVVKSGEIIRINNDDTVEHRFVTTDNSFLGIPGSVGSVPGSNRYIDSGVIAAGDSVDITLPTGLPVPYWFNLVEVVDQAGTGLTLTPLVERPRLTVMHFNPSCLVN